MRPSQNAMRQGCIHPRMQLGNGVNDPGSGMHPGVHSVQGVGASIPECNEA